jgi:transcriptional regulator with XRE-family HTH domain
MARTALGWGARDLARAAEVSPDTVARFERGDALKEITVEVIQRTLERAGVVFIGVSGGGPGARLSEVGELRHGNRPEAVRAPSSADFRTTALRTGKTADPKAHLSGHGRRP